MKAFHCHSRPIGLQEVVYFSGKISNSVLAYLDREGLDLEGLYDLTDLPMEFLRDPTSWIEAEKLEKFIRIMDQSYGIRYPDQCFIANVGHKCHELRAWGVLDSVLRMMQKPSDIYIQPERFISYFVSPEPPVEQKQRGEQNVSFNLPISSDEYPYVTEYIKSAFEALPLYVDQTLASATWNKTTVEISWFKPEARLISEADIGKHIKPELVQSMVASLESLQKELQRKSEELKYKDQEIHRLRGDVNNLLNTPLKSRTWDYENLSGEAIIGVERGLAQVKDQFLKLTDYMARAQQLITLLVGQGRLDAQAKTAMRRVGWDQVVTGTPQVTRESIQQLEGIKQCLKQLESTSKEVVKAKMRPSGNQQNTLNQN